FAVAALKRDRGGLSVRLRHRSPRRIRRGRIEARASRLRMTTRFNVLHGEFAVAALKHLGPFVLLPAASVLHGEFAVAALKPGVVTDAIPGYISRSPRRIRRGRIEAQAMRSLRTAYPIVLHGEFAVAALKHQGAHGQARVTRRSPRRIRRGRI